MTLGLGELCSLLEILRGLLDFGSLMTDVSSSEESLDTIRIGLAGRFLRGIFRFWLLIVRLKGVPCGFFRAFFRHF